MFKFLIILFILFFVVPFVLKTALRIVVGNVLFSNQNTEKHSYQAPNKKEGELTVNHIPKSKNKADLGGDYIDFEEIKE